MHSIPAMLVFNEQIMTVQAFQIHTSHIKIAAVQGGRGIHIYFGPWMQAQLPKQALLIIAKFFIGHSECRADRERIRLR